MPAQRERTLLVIADDLGIGPNTTSGILQLAAKGIVTGTVLIVNSPYAVEAVKRWRTMGAIPEVGWHPNLTLDYPIAPASQVPSLVRPDGSFYPLGAFLKRWVLGLFDPRDIEIELQHQLHRFITMVGYPPVVVNFHQHLGLFAPVGEVLMRVLSDLHTKPYVRRVQEPWTVWRALPGSRVKRAFLGLLGRRLSRQQEALGFPGNDWLAGIANSPCIQNPQFFVRWLRTIPGDVVELMCHPGHYDPTLIGRDCTIDDGLLQQRINELNWLGHPSFLDAVKDAGFRLASPSEYLFGRQQAAQAA